MTNRVSSRQRGNWLRQLCSGDKAAFTRFVNEYQQLVFLCCKTLGLNETEADDVASKTFLAACIVIPLAMVGCILAFSKIIMANLGQGLNTAIAQAGTGVQQYWQISLVVIGVIAFMVYGSYDLFFAKNTR